MKDKSVLVKCRKGSFPGYIKDVCKRCGKQFDASKGELYTIFASVTIAEVLPNNANVSYNVFCNDCTHEIAKFIGSKQVTYRGKKVN